MLISILYYSQTFMSYVCLSLNMLIWMQKQSVSRESWCKNIFAGIRVVWTVMWFRKQHPLACNIYSYMAKPDWSSTASQDNTTTSRQATYYFIRYGFIIQIIFIWSLFIKLHFTEYDGSNYRNMPALNSSFTISVRGTTMVQFDKWLIIWYK